MPGHDNTRFILIGTSHGGNVGATARAMKVMGFSELVLIAPRDRHVQRKAEAIAMASGATDVLANARVVDDMTQALAGVTFVCATAMTPRDFGPPTHAPRELFATLKDSSHRVAFVFGSKWSQRNQPPREDDLQEELDRARARGRVRDHHLAGVGHVAQELAADEAVAPGAASFVGSAARAARKAPRS